MRPADSALVLIQGLYHRESSKSADAALARNTHYLDHAGEAHSMGVDAYHAVDGSRRRMANRMLKRFRGTAPAPELVEIMSIDGSRLRDCLARDDGCAQWQSFYAGHPKHWDMDRSFILLGRPRIMLAGNTSGQRLLWFGNGIDTLSRDQFIDHYTARHGPLVAGFAGDIGLRSYYQVANEEEELCDTLRELGLGRGQPSATFAELRMGKPPLRLRDLKASRIANAAISRDEKRHINFAESMLLLCTD